MISIMKKEKKMSLEQVIIVQVLLYATDVNIFRVAGMKYNERFFETAL